jgi:AraC-like DNA-binding protein
MLLFEMERPSQGSVVMIARILDLLFIQILRAWAAGRDGPASWLAGALDPQIGPAVSSIHADPGHDWTVDQLAGLCNLSRSRFSERFTERVGKTTVDVPDTGPPRRRRKAAARHLNPGRSDRKYGRLHLRAGV